MAIWCHTVALACVANENKNDSILLMKGVQLKCFPHSAELAALCPAVHVHECVCVCQWMLLCVSQWQAVRQHGSWRLISASLPNGLKCLHAHVHALTLTHSHTHRLTARSIIACDWILIPIHTHTDYQCGINQKEVQSKQGRHQKKVLKGDFLGYTVVNIMLLMRNFLLFRWFWIHSCHFRKADMVKLMWKIPINHRWYLSRLSLSIYFQMFSLL